MSLMSVFITAVPIIKLFGRGKGDSSLNSPNSGIGLFYADSGFFDGNIRFFGRIGSGIVFMVDSENVGKGEIQERNRTVVHLMCEIRRASRLEFLARLSCGKVAERSNRFIFNLARKISCGISSEILRARGRNFV
jgi:hypothetical protein